MLKILTLKSYFRIHGKHVTISSALVGFQNKYAEETKEHFNCIDEVRMLESKKNLTYSTGWGLGGSGIGL